MRWDSSLFHHPARQVRQAITLTLVFAAAALVGGCSSSGDLAGARVPNALPDTRVVAQSPSPLTGGFVIHFAWTGSDADGKVRGYQWRISNNGLDGISIRDTLTIDPVSGDTLLAWRSTTAEDSTFIVSADLPGLPGEVPLPPRDKLSFQTHTFFVRAVDDEGGVDPTPAMVSFTATTIAPTIIVDRPAGLHGYMSAQIAPPTITFGWTGTDPDFETGVPTRVRYLWKRGELPTRYVYCTTQYDFLQNKDHLCSFSDPAWSDWFPYEPRAEDRTVTFRDIPQRDEQNQLIGYIFAVQARDTAGAVTPDLTYGRNVQNITISYTMTPLLEVYEPYLGTSTNVGIHGVSTYDIAQDQPVAFMWAATADNYASTVVAYRYGWDLVDATDENDPGWALPPGNTPDHRRAPQRTFAFGTHTLTVQAWDEAGGLTRINIVLNVVVVPVIERRPLLLVDDVIDKGSQGWLGSDGVAHDEDAQRDAFWIQTLSANGGVMLFDPGRDVIDLQENPSFGYRDALLYDNIIWLEKRTASNYAWYNFDPRDGDKFVWLQSFQKLAGHVFLCGQQALAAFAGDYGMVCGQDRATFMYPLIFDTDETCTYAYGQVHALGFGTRILPDGTSQLIGPTRYPYAAAGIDALDAPSGQANLVWPGTPGPASIARKSNCEGLMGLVLDPGFRAAHGAAGVPDTILTSLVIDYKDDPAGYPAKPRLEDTFVWGLDEFYDTNVTSRPTPINAQVMPDGSPAIEPMWRFESRFDWIKTVHAQRGDAGWPGNAYTPEQLKSVCGNYAIGPNGRAVADAAPVGFISHKTEWTKPVPGGDVFWGFDPSRFDPQPMQRAIRWVLGEVFRLRMTAP